jgi:hypothetical protein
MRNSIAASHQIDSGGVGYNRRCQVIRHIDGRSNSSVARICCQSGVELPVAPEITNIKLVARRGAMSLSSSAASHQIYSGGVGCKRRCRFNERIGWRQGRAPGDSRTNRASIGLLTLKQPT